MKGLQYPNYTTKVDKKPSCPTWGWYKYVQATFDLVLLDNQYVTLSSEGIIQKLCNVKLLNITIKGVCN